MSGPRPFVAIPVLLLLGLLGGACGYRPLSPGLEGDRLRVAVATLSNQTREQGLELMMSDALREELLRRGNMRLIEDPDVAEVVLSGKLSGIRTTAQTLSSTVLALEYNVTMTLDLAVVKRGAGVFDPGRRVLQEAESYLASADVEAERKNRKEALRRLTRVLASRVHDAIDVEVRR